MIIKHIEEEGDQEVLENIDTLLKNLREKEEKYEDLVSLNQTLIVKERKSNDELQEALKELVNVCKEAYNGLLFYMILQCIWLELWITWFSNKNTKTINDIL